LIGKLDEIPSKTIRTSSTKAAATTISTVPKLATRVVLSDFAEVAKAVLAERAWIYASSTSNPDDRVKWYKQVWSQLFFRPRVMRNVSIVDPSTRVLSFPTRYPFFIAPMGLVGTVHAEGELALARAAAQRGVHYCISTAASKSHEEVISAFRAEQREQQQQQQATSTVVQSELFFQLYVHSQREVTQTLLRKIRALGYKGLFITADTPVVGKRSVDRRLQAQEMIDAGLDSAAKPTQKKVEGGRAPPGVLSSSLNWDDLSWIRREWPGPIVVKGVQSAADVKMAAGLGVEGVYLSNHGGRQLQDAPSSLDTLLETRRLYPEVFGRLEILVDGSFSTGTDVLKALCLGATAVGLGRPFIYAVAGYGAQGALKAIDSRWCPVLPVIYFELYMLTIFRNSSGRGGRAGNAVLGCHQCG
jgi:L-lactate dehydrogenase (cytochrome)